MKTKHLILIIVIPVAVVVLLLIAMAVKTDREPAHVQVTAQETPAPSPAAAEIADETIPGTAWLLLNADSPHSRESILTRHLLGLMHILGAPRPRGRIKEASIDINQGATQDMKTRLMFHTHGPGAVIDAIVLQEELANKYHPAGRMLQSAVITNAETFPERPYAPVFILPVEMELTGSLSAIGFTEPTQLFPEGLLLHARDEWSAIDTFINKTAQAISVSLHAAPPHKISPLEDSLRMELSFATTRFSALVRLIYILEHETGARIEQLIIKNDLNEDPVLRGTLIAVFNIRKSGLADEADGIDVIYGRMAERAESLIPMPQWDLISALDGPDARLALESIAAISDPGRPDWAAAEDRLMVRTTRRDERGRTVLVTTIGNAAENEVLSMIMGHWLYRWRVHSITMTNGEFARIDAQPLPIVPPGLPEAADVDHDHQPPLPFK